MAKSINKSYNTADKRKGALVDKGYLSNTGTGRGSYKINHLFFCTTRLTARFLISYRQLRKDGYVSEEVLLKETTDSVFNGNKEHAKSTLKASIGVGYLTKHPERKNQIEEGCLNDHYQYLLLIRI